MLYMHCQVRFTDYSKWRATMDADGPAQREAGIFLKHLWRGIDDQSVAFFVCEVRDRERAAAFLNPADVSEAQKNAGASDFQWFFVEDVTHE